MSKKLTSRSPNTAWLTGWNDGLDALEAEKAQAVESSNILTDAKFAEYFHPQVFSCVCGKSYSLMPKALCQSPAEAQQVAVPAEDGWYGHKFKEVTRGIWRCNCGKQLTESENKCMNGTQNTLQSQPPTADAEDMQTHSGTYPGREAHALSTPEAASHKAQQVAVLVPLSDEQIIEIISDNSLDTIHAVARAIEAHHGIGAKPEQKPDWSAA